MKRVSAVVCALLFMSSGAVAAEQIGASATDRDTYQRVVAHPASLSPEVVERFNEAARLADAGDTGQAIRLFSEIAQAYPHLPEPLNNLAVLYAREGRVEEAKQALEQAINTNQSYATVYENLSTVYLEMARDSYVKALQLGERPEAPQLQMLADLGNLAPASAPATTAVAAAKPQPAGIEPVKVASVEEQIPDATRVDKPAPAQEAPPAAVEPSATPVKPAMDPLQAAVESLNGWAAAWSAQDVDAYLGFYSSDFRPSGKPSRARWEAQRRTRLKRPKWIKVRLSDIKLRPRDDGTLTATFVQEYRSNTYKDRVKKSITLIGEDDRWLIKAERTLKVLSR